MSKRTWSASVMCAPLGNLEHTLKTLEAAGCHELHFDIMDGTFVPNFTLGPDFVRMAKECTSLPCDAHLMIERPERYIDRFVEAGCDTITVHVEACTHAHRVLGQIRDAGASPGIAINPATSLTKLQYLLSSVDRVLVMTVDPGYAGQTLIPSAVERVKILHENLQYLESRATIQVDGNINAWNAAELEAHGARNFVLGTSSIFKGGDLTEALHDFEKAVDAEAATL